MSTPKLQLSIEFSQPESLEKAKEMIQRLDQTKNENTFQLGGIFVWVKEELRYDRKSTLKVNFSQWLRINVNRFTQRTVERYMHYFKKCIEANEILNDLAYTKTIKKPKIDKLSNFTFTIDDAKVKPTRLIQILTKNFAPGQTKTKTITVTRK